MKRHYSGTPRETIPLAVIDFFVDFYAKWIYKKRKRDFVTDAPTFLIASLGHLGDALTVSYLFPIIRQKYPDAAIDVLSPSWCNAVNENNPFVRHIFNIDHYLCNRSQLNIWQKIKQQFRSFQKTLPAIRDKQYDYYIDVRTSVGVSHFILPFTNVKKAVGFNRRGLGGLLDVELDVPKQDTYHHFVTYAMLLKEMGIEVKLENVVPYFDISPNIRWQSVYEKLSFEIVTPYILLFPETGEPHRQMSPEFWAEILSSILQKSNYSVIFCGQTDFSSLITKKIRGTNDPMILQRVIDASKKLSIQDIAFIAQKSEYALTLDSFPEHLSCIFCKTITIYRAAGLPFYPIANFQVLLFHSHLASVGVEYERKSVEVLYYPEMDIPEVKNRIVEQVLC